MQSLAYRVPDGKVDIPYIYIYDASGLTDGRDYMNQAVTTFHDSDFILRRIAGMRNVIESATGAGMYQVYRPGQNPFFASPIKIATRAPGAALLGSLAVMPEVRYPASSLIVFDLYDVLRRTMTGDAANFISDLAFCGVRRFDARSFYLHHTSYAYRELPYTYCIDVTIDWSRWTDGVNNIPTAPRTFYVEVLERDFELCALDVQRMDTGVPLASPADFKLSIYDVARTTKFSSSPVQIRYMNDNDRDDSAYSNPVFPVPSLVWPTKGLIQFEVTSLLNFGAAAQHFRFHFNGIWREKA